MSYNEKKAIIGGLNVFHNEEFGGIDVNIHPDEMRHHGFNLGDSFDFVFSNGNELKNVPYFDVFSLIKMTMSFAHIQHINFLDL